jgi:hypothetical protein
VPELNDLGPDTTVREILSQQPDAFIGLLNFQPRFEKFCGVRNEDTLSDICYRNDLVMETVHRKVRAAGK